VKLHRRIVLYSVAVFLMTAGLTLFNVAEAGATTPGGSCVVNIGGTLPTGTFYAMAPSGFTLAVTCTSVGTMATGDQLNIVFDNGGYSYDVQIGTPGSTQTLPGSFSFASTSSYGFQTFGGVMFAIDVYIHNAPLPWSSWSNGALSPGPVGSSYMFIENYSGGWLGQLGTGAVSGAGIVAGPCTLTAVYGYNNADNANGFMGYSEHMYTFDVSGSYSGVIISANYDPSYPSGLTPQNYFASFPTPGTNSPGTQSYVYSSAAGVNGDNSVTNVGVNETSTQIGNLPTALNAWCYDAGTWYSWGELMATALHPGSGKPGSGTPPGTPIRPTCSALEQMAGTCSNGGGFNWSACMSGEGIGLNPSSWVPYLVSGGKCVLQWTFDPCPTTGPCTPITNLEDQFGLGSSTPSVGASSASQWLGNVGYMLTVGPHAGAVDIQNCVSAGCTSSVLLVGMHVTVRGHTYTADAPSAIAAVAGSGGSWSTVLVDMLAAALLVLFFIEVARWIRKVIGSTE